MLRLWWTSDAQPRSKNGQPPQSTTGVASASSSQSSAAGDSRRRRRPKASPPSRRAAAARSRRPRSRTAGSCRQLGVPSSPPAARPRLERHAADRAGARPVADDLGVHRAGVADRPRSGGRRRRLGRRRLVHKFWRREIARGVAPELLAAAGARSVAQPPVLGMMRGRRGIDVMPQTGSSAVAGTAVEGCAVWSSMLAWRWAKLALALHNLAAAGRIPHTDVPVRPRVGMIGEITLRGRVLPVGRMKKSACRPHTAPGCGGSSCQPAMRRTWTIWAQSCG